MSTTDARAVLDGQKIKWTLEQVETQNPDLVRVDWLRFTVPVHQLVPDVDPTDPERNFLAYQRPELGWAERLMATLERDWDLYRGSMPDDLAMSILRCDGQDYYATPRTLATIGALDLAKLILGDDGEAVFPLAASAESSGMDYYSARCPVLFEGELVGYVLAGGKQQAQANTVHFNLFGAACLRIKPSDLRRIADYVDRLGGWITRCDLSLDIWDGLDIQAVSDAWAEGQFDVRGKRPKQAEAGSWRSGHSRTFYVGARSNGKLFRAYEKGDEQFGPEAEDPWVRCEIEYRSNHRIISTDILRRPADFFAGAYPYCELILAQAGRAVNPAKVPNVAQVLDATAHAAAARQVKWVFNTAGAAIAAVWNLGGDFIAHVVSQNQHKTPRRLRGFKRDELISAFEKVAASFGPSFAHI